MDDTLEDFTQKYKDAYVWLKTGSNELLTKFIGVQENGLWFSQPDIGEINVKFDQARKSVSTRFPQRGLYNILDGAAFFYRIPTRQFKQSPCEANCRLDQLGVDNITHAIDFDNLIECFKPTYPKTKLQATKLLQENGSVALSPKLGLTLTDRADYDLWYHNNLIGSIINQQVTVDYAPLKQEVIDFFGKDLQWKN